MALAAIKGEVWLPLFSCNVSKYLQTAMFAYAVYKQKTYVFIH